MGEIDEMASASYNPDEFVFGLLMKDSYSTGQDLFAKEANGKIDWSTPRSIEITANVELSYGVSAGRRRLVTLSTGPSITSVLGTAIAQILVLPQTWKTTL